MDTGSRNCPSCSARLAADNPGPRCSPCGLSALRRRASAALRMTPDEAVVRRAFAEGGVPRLAEVLGCTAAEALDVALLRRLIPPAYRRRARLLARLVELGPVSHVVAAERLGLSRWTVATYRRQLGVAERGRLAS